ncbi:MAG TPA: cytochrome c biogenesis protein CcsA [bacterium]
MQLALFVLRWREGGHTPVTGLFESQHFLAIFVVAHALSLLARHRAWGLFAAALGLALASLAAASFGPAAIKPLTPALDTPLFFLHVAASFAAYGLFGSAALVALLRLAPGGAVPSARAILDESLYLGWILFTWAMIAGSIWAYLAWGSYWTWNTKGIWSYLLWFFYAGVIHVRTRPAWQGRRLDLLALAGYAAVLFTYLGLGLLLKTNHPLL